MVILVIIGVNERGQKHFLTIEDGLRESTQSWREDPLRLKNRGMNAPQLAICDGALGFWNALNEIYGDTRPPSTLPGTLDSQYIKQAA